MIRRIDPVRIVLLLVFAALAISSLLQESPTFDEPFHLAQGFRYWKTGDPSYVVEDHPPVVQAIAAIPFVLAGRPLEPISREDPPSWAVRAAESARFISAGNGLNLRLAMASRAIIVLLACVLGWFIYSESRRLFGTAGARLSLFLFALDPNFLAHSRLVTTDLGAALGTGAFLVSLLRWARDPGPGRAALTGLALGFALLAKHSSVALLTQAPILIAILVVGRRDGLRIPRIAAHAAYALGTAALLVWSAHGFSIGTLDGARPARSVSLRHPTQAQSADSTSPGDEPLAASPRRSALDKIPLPAPDYLFGMRTRVRLVFDWERPAYLHGEFSTKGFRSYFPIALAIKTPIPTLLLALAALLTFLRVRPSREEVVLLAFVGIYFFAAVRGSLNIGYRHLLPILPPLFVLSGRLASSRVAEAFFARVPRVARAVLAVLLAWLAFGTARIHPHYLAYFNETVGGPSNGWKWLVDASLDWGQDLPGLARWLREHDIQTVHLNYFGRVDPKLYGIQWAPVALTNRKGEKPRIEDIPDGVYAISVTNLVGTQSLGAGSATVFRELEPIARVGYSIHIYEVKREGAPAPSN